MKALQKNIVFYLAVLRNNLGWKIKQKTNELFIHKSSDV
jgi:hypothetical protein